MQQFWAVQKDAKMPCEQLQKIQSIGQFFGQPLFFATESSLFAHLQGSRRTGVRERSRREISLDRSLNRFVALQDIVVGQAGKVFASGGPDPNAFTAW